NTAANAPSLYNNSSTPTISYSDIQGCGGSGSWNSACGTDGGGNIDADPRFVDADGADNIYGTADDDPRLQLTSPAIDAGNNNAVPPYVTTDLDGLPRFMDIPAAPDTGNGTPPIVDMGAHESPFVLYAAPTAQGSGNCSSWANACTLPTALTDAVSGNEIWVKMGIHYPGASGNRSATFQLKNNVAVYGGFAGTETQRSQRNWQTNKTILSGDIDQNDITDGGVVTTTANIVGNNAYHVVTGGGTDSSAVLDGFFITAGQANGSGTHTRGGGMYNDHSSPTLSHVTFSGNSANTYGGGMYNLNNSNPTLTNITFSGNSAYYGGGMYNGSSSPTLSHVTFSGNSAKWGGGMFNDTNSNPTQTNGTFSGNTASDSGGGMYNYESNPTLANVTFSGNSADDYGGGMYNFSSIPTLANVILWGNTATNGASIYNDSSTPTISYSDAQGCGGSGGSWNSACGTDGGGNIDADPLFVDAAGGNLRLGFGSPAIESGTNNGCPATDLDGLPRPTDGNGDSTATCDMGAYEAGTMLCGIAQGQTYTFTDQSDVSITITAPGSDLSCLYVDEMELNHPNATSGIQTGRYWLIRGLQSDKQADATGFTVNLTLPHVNLSDPQVCKYPGGLGGYGWDCARSGFDAATVWRAGVAAFSDWAVGHHVGPTAVRLEALTARAPSVPLAGGLTAIALLVLAGWTRRRRQDVDSW
ncbi:MAG: right-handed parallel beta-helix repeat-containing protein, partial [Anaerolineae bacterium]